MVSYCVLGYPFFGYPNCKLLKKFVSVTLRSSLSNFWYISGINSQGDLCSQIIETSQHCSMLWKPNGGWPTVYLSRILQRRRTFRQNRYVSTVSTVSTRHLLRHVHVSTTFLFTKLKANHYYILIKYRRVSRVVIIIPQTCVSPFIWVRICYQIAVSFVSRLETWPQFADIWF